MEGTGIFAKNEDLEKLKTLVSLGWKPNQPMIVFSVGEGISRDMATTDAKKACHKLALAYGLPEISGYYGIKYDGEFVKTE